MAYYWNQNGVWRCPIHSAGHNASQRGEKTSADIKSADIIVILFAVCILVLIVILLCHSRKMVNSIINPVNDLRTAFSFIHNDDLSGNVPTEASSRDLKVLLDAFSNLCNIIMTFYYCIYLSFFSLLYYYYLLQLIVALRFGSESYAKGDPLKARSAFTEALKLFVLTGSSAQFAYKTVLAHTCDYTVLSIPRKQER